MVTHAAGHLPVDIGFFIVFVQSSAVMACIDTLF
jgi:hypothetical protein